MDTSKQMPDLMGAAHASHGDANGSRRILARLEHGPRAQARPARAWDVDGWTVGLILLLLTMCGIAWLMHEETITPVTFKSRSSSTPTMVPVPVPTPTTATAAGQVHAAQAAGHADPQAAAIINTPHAAPPTLVAIPMPEARLARQPQAAAPNAIADKSSSHKPVSTARARPGIDVAQAKPASTSDTDVALLTALVAHAGQPASVAPERTRDVVERQDGDRTADLLRRCKQLGLMEGMLCRSRICSGSWESDAACRAPAN